jgi:hypothetical protein
MQRFLELGAEVGIFAALKRCVAPPAFYDR